MPRLIQRLGRPIIKLVDRMMVSGMHTKPIPGSTVNLVLYRIIPYHGLPTTLPDGTQIQPGDPVLDFHLSNRTMLSGVVNGVALQSEMALIPLMRQELDLMCKLTAQGVIPEYKSAYSLSFFGPILRRLGFEVFPAVTNASIRSQMRWMRCLRYFLAPDYTKASKNHHKDRPAYHVWYSHQKMCENAARLEKGNE